MIQYSHSNSVIAPGNRFNKEMKSKQIAYKEIAKKRIIPYLY